MKKIIITIGYFCAALWFLTALRICFSQMPSSFSDWFGAVFSFFIGVGGLWALFFLKEPRRLGAVIFLIWLEGFALALTCVPGIDPFGWGALTEAWRTLDGRWRILRGLFFCVWSLAGMGQAFLKEPRRSTVIIIHTLITIAMFNLWFMPLKWVKEWVGIISGWFGL